MHPNNKFERNNIKKKLFNYYEFGLYSRKALEAPEGRLQAILE